MKTFTRFGVAALLLLVLASLAAAAPKADCVRDGKRYPHGSVIGGYICIDGNWKKL